MTRRVRLGIFAVAGAGLAALLFWGLVGLPDFGHYHWPYGNALNAVATSERHTTNVVAAVVFDYRGFDTLGEELILFTAVAGVSMLLRKDPEKHVPEDAVRSDPIRGLGALAVAMLFVLGLWLVAFGYVTPGGGFQGGVVIAGAFLLVYLVGGYREFHSLTPHSVIEVGEAIGAGAFAVLGFVGLVYAGTYLGNFLGLGNAGSLYSGGSIPLLNWATAIEVCAATVMLFKEYLNVYMLPAGEWQPELGPR